MYQCENCVTPTPAIRLAIFTPVGSERLTSCHLCDPCYALFREEGLYGQTDAVSYFRDPIVPAKRRLNEFEANRRDRQSLENKLIGEHGFSDEQAEAAVKSQRPQLYERQALQK